ncbi:unnamed protein product [Allacma fusca]|uniref:Deltamethrin resistance protein prag01 domain-containing protein n=1 Tax=Allacma fusca TaxID=39272 RepID=A0A8J2NX07_9HEXA|nr:unnamed protein product [Allacma fusca]
MNSRPLISAARRFIAPRTVVASSARMMSGHGHHAVPHELRPVHLDELPVPEGSWQTYHDQQNLKFNIHLLVGVGFAIFTYVAIQQSGVMTWNASIPKLPEEGSK